jgi:hypothetical protein
MLHQRVHDSNWSIANCYGSLHPTNYPWVHNKIFKTYDHQA